jgi:hypothetical protein
VVTLAHCRRLFYDLAQGGNAPLAEETLLTIAALYKIETEIIGQTVETRRATRLEKTRPLPDGFKAWLDVNLKRVPGRSKIAEAMRYAITYWDGLNRFLEDGRIEIDSNSVERAIKPITLTRKDALFEGDDRGAAHWAIIASLDERRRSASLSRRHTYRARPRLAQSQNR